MYVRKALGNVLLDADHAELRRPDGIQAQDLGHTNESTRLRERSTTYRRRLFEKTGLAVAVGDNDDNLSNLEAM